MIETSWDYVAGDGVACFSSNEKRWVTKVRKLAEQYSDDVTIVRQPEDNGGVIYARFPPKWLKIAPPIKRNLTDEQREALAARLRKNIGGAE